MKTQVKTFAKKLILPALLTGIIFSSCSKSYNDNTPQPDVSGLLVLNAAADLNSVNFAIGNSYLFNGSAFAYQNYSGGYAGVYSGTQTTRSFDFTGAGAEIARAAYTYKKNGSYSLFLTGANRNYVLVNTEDKFDLLNADKTKAIVRYAYLVPDSGLVNVSYNGTADVAVKYKTVSDFKAFAPGNLAIDVKKSDGTAMAPSRTIALAAGNAYTLIIAGKPDPSIPVGLQPSVKYIVNVNANGQASPSGMISKAP